ncbi:MAG: radical SAM protein [Chloroflexi bacterium]|nr:radical SAM protein [Chloroflexota bacterium]
MNDHFTSAQQPVDLTFGLPENVPQLASLYIYAAGSCNLACRHCWIVPKFQPNGNGGPYIKIETVEKVIREGKGLGLHTVKLTGGEPLMNPQIRDIISLIDDAGLSIMIETNGILVDVLMAEFLKSKSRVDFISISLDGSNAETHDGLRSVPGSFDQAVRGIKNLVEVGFRPQVICTLHRGNSQQMEEVINFAAELGCSSVKFNNLQSSGRGDSFMREAGLSIAEIVDLYKHLENDIIPTRPLPIHFDIPFAFHPVRRFLQDSLGKCAVLNILGVLSTGELALCGIGTTIPELIYGHADTDDLRDVWCNAPGLINLRETVPFKMDGVCGRCIHRDFCLGTCVANNYHVAGRLDAPFSFCDQAEKLGMFPSSRIR